MSERDLSTEDVDRIRILISALSLKKQKIMTEWPIEKRISAVNVINNCINSLNGKLGK